MKAGEPLPTGHLLDGRYRIGKVIGVGGMGRVYLANDTRLANRPVAVKEMMVGEGLQEQKAVEDFSREARVLAPLSHPGIPNLIDYFAERGRHYLVMEYISGGDLQGLLDQRGAGARVPEAQVLRWAREILDVLAFLHSQDPPIVYRDLKPGNIMIDQHGRAMIIDFGIARFLPPGGRGTQIGSVGYAPPEQYLGKLEPRSDLYSLGATMHHLLTGRDPQLEPPFSFPPVRELASGISPHTERLVMWTLEREAHKRPASAAAMLESIPAVEGSDDAASILPLAVGTDPSLNTMRTQVLSKAAPAPAPVKKSPPPAARQPASPPPVRRAASKPAASSVPVSRPVSSAASFAGAGQGNGLAAAPAVNVPAATLICKNEPIRFTVPGVKAVIGRHTGPADVIDIDLGVLKTGGDRISRRHAEIIKRGNDYYIRDLGSLNGTFILGQGRLGRDQLYKLEDRSQVVIGSATLEFRRG
jgi:serine/threonine-protein kinase